MSNYGRKYRKAPERNAKATPLKEAMNQMFKEFRLARRFNEARLISSWENIVGHPIASRTSNIYIKDKKLFVKLSSAPLKKELSMSKQRILELLEKEAGKGVVEDIFFL